MNTRVFLLPILSILISGFVPQPQLTVTLPTVKAAISLQSIEGEGSLFTRLEEVQEETQVKSTED
jgi:hypothetical protein